MQHRLRLLSRAKLGAILALGLVASTAPLAAQSTGTIRGTVVDEQSLQPLSGAQVTVAGTPLGTLTNATGQFMLLNVPAGTQTVRAQYIGYGTAEQTANVVAGQTAELTIRLGQSAIALDEVVVTGSPAGEQRRRAIGTSVSSINVEERVQDAPITSFAELMQGSEAGVVGMSASGSPGTAGPMLLRGVTSLTQDNQPLIYIDGVRADQFTGTLVGTGGQAVSRLNDINPQDIARIEIVKGAAATALYGSEASSGVIQIFTKRGRPGETTYNVGVRLGTNWIPEDLPLQHFDPKYPSANDFLDPGAHQEYTLSMRGGSQDGITYYVGGGHTDTEGGFATNSMQRTTARVTLGFTPSENISADLTSSFGYTDVLMSPNDNVTSGILTTLYLGNPVTRATPQDPWGGAFIPVPLAASIRISDEAYRYSGGLTLNHRITEGLSQRATVGLDLLSGRGISNTPYWAEQNRADRPGGRTVNSRNNLQVNVDYGATLTHRLTSSIESQTSAGGQLFTRRDHRVNASGNDFAGPGLQALGGTAVPNVGESQISYTTGGAFVQQQFGFNDRLFLIAGVRADGSSAFGEEFGWLAFPKASVSYVLSEESWFTIPGVSLLRLRGGFGMAGTQPGAFDAVRLYSPFTAMHGRPAMRASARGNPDLAPEVSREFEGGLDMGLFEDRVSLTFTAYHQRTEDVLLEQQFAPSLGILGTQLTNVGKVRNRGLESNLSVRLVQTPSFDWSVSGGYAYNDNVVEDLGGAAPITVDRFGSRIVEGYPVSGKWERVTVGENANGFPIASDTAVYIGPSIAPHTGNLGTDLSAAGFTVRATGQFALGHVVNNHTRPYMGHNRTGEDYWRVVEASGGDANAVAVQQFVQRSRIYGDFIEDADWFKLREVSVSYQVPATLSDRFGANSVSLNVAGRNLLTLTKYSGSDPEVSATFGSGNNLSIGADFFTVPPGKQIVAGVNIQF